SPISNSSQLWMKTVLLPERFHPLTDKLQNQSNVFPAVERDDSAIDKYKTEGPLPDSFPPDDRILNILSHPSPATILNQ
ncbi:hypothetical protein NPIL_514691, partial [Nephila pilipes]